MENVFYGFLIVVAMVAAIGLLRLLIGSFTKIKLSEEGSFTKLITDLSEAKLSEKPSIFEMVFAVFTIIPIILGYRIFLFAIHNFILSAIVVFIFILIANN